MSVPGILIAVVLVFILTFGDYAITRVAGPVYPSSLSVLMYTKAFTLQQWGSAACIGMVIIVASLGLRRDLRPRRPRHRGDGTMTADAMTLDVCRDRQRLSFGRFISLLIIALLVIWTAVPLFMAVMWSLVNPGRPWSPPAVLPPSLSLAQWEYVFTYSEIVKAVTTSFILAPIVTVLSFVLSLPTAYAHRPLRLSAARRRCASSSCCRSSCRRW